MNGWFVFAIQFVGAVIVYFGLLLLFKERLILDTIIKFKNKIFKKQTAKISEEN